MPALPFIMYTIFATFVFFVAGIGYVSIEHLMERERLQGLAGEHVAITAGLEAYRAENGVFPSGADWLSRVAPYSPGGPVLDREGGTWTYTLTAGSYSLCFEGDRRDEPAIVNSGFICPPAGSGAPDAGSDV